MTFILSDKDREEWKQGLERDEEMKALRVHHPEPVAVPEPVSKPVKKVRKSKVKKPSTPKSKGRDQKDKSRVDEK